VHECLKLEGYASNGDDDCDSGQRTKRKYCTVYSTEVNTLCVTRTRVCIEEGC
jgi:hypothetical protein